MPRKGNRPFRKTVVRYVGADGKRCTSTTEGAVKHVEHTDTYYAKIGGKVISLETTDEGEAWAKLKRLLKRNADERAGIRDQHTDAAELPLSSHVDDWIATVRAKGSGEGHLQLMRTRVLRLANLAGWRSIADIDEDSCNDALASLQTTVTDAAHVGEDGESRGLSSQTRNHYARHVKQFSRWLARGKHRRLTEDPLSGVDMVNVEEDRRHERRIPTDEEIVLLFEWLAGDARTGVRNRVAFRNQMTPARRAIGYKISMATGYRVSEMRTLDAASFDLEAGTVSVRAAYAKNRRFDVQHLPTWLVEELCEWRDAGGEMSWPFPGGKSGRTLKRDLQDARLTWIKAGVSPAEQKARSQSTTLCYSIPGPNGPLFFDFHSLRHYFVTQIVNTPGVSPKVMMALCRHSSPHLSLKIYGKIRDQGELKAVVNTIPNPRK